MKKFILVLLAMLMTFGFTGCKGASTNAPKTLSKEEYTKEIERITTEIETEMTLLSEKDTDSMDEEAAKAMIGEMTATLTTLCGEIKALVPPNELIDADAKFKSGADKYIDALKSLNDGIAEESEEKILKYVELLLDGMQDMMDGASLLEQ